MTSTPLCGRWELSVDDPGYPVALRDLAEPPPRLYGYGDVTILGDGLAVVGSRRATPYGISCTTLFAGWCASHGITIVSGAAIGCDVAAHKAALAQDGPTVAVLPCGADVDYPSSARAVLGVLRSRGAVVSEVPWGMPPMKWNFVARNRIIAALAQALLVVEAGLPSGTFTTADHALAIGREVYAVPGSIYAPESRGSNRLIRQGAIPITDVSELAEALGREVIRSDTRTCTEPLLSALQAHAMRPDDVARELGLDIVEVVRGLSALELEGRIARYVDGRYGAVRA